jgi:HAMP domain-containing protein
VGLRLLGRLRHLSLRLQLQLVMLSLLVLSVGSLFVLHMKSEGAMLARISDYTEELSTAIQIAQEQPAAGLDPQRAVQAYAEKLRQLGVREVSIADASEAVVTASTNPLNVGRRLTRRRGPKEYVVRGVLGDEGTVGRPTTTNLTVPIVVGDRRVGYVVITRILDDFSSLSQTALANRIAMTLAVFALGMLLSLFLASAVSRPVKALRDAAERVAAGDLQAQVRAAGSDEMRTLAGSFNQMVERLSAAGAAARGRALDGDGPLRIGARARDPQPAQLDQPRDRPRPHPPRPGGRA